MVMRTSSPPTVVSATRKVFVVMPFNDEFREVYENGIKAACQAIPNVDCVRVDERIFTDGILDRIFKEIDSADLIIGEMSVHNPNVYFEIGYAKGRQKQVLLIARDVEKIPSDLRHVKYVIYEGNVDRLRTLLTSTVRAVLDPTTDLGPRNIGGTWKGTVVAEQPNPLFPEVPIEIQFRWTGERVEGLATIDIAQDTLHLKFLGQFEYATYLMFTYRSQNEADMQVGAAVLEIDGRGKQLAGHYVGYGPINRRIVYGRITVLKQSSPAPD